MCVCVFVVSGYYINQLIFLNWINDWTGEAETRWQLNQKMLEDKKKEKQQLKIKSCASFTILFFFSLLATTHLKTRKFQVFPVFCFSLISTVER
jgi:hypothetical protein